MIFLITQKKLKKGIHIINFLCYNNYMNIKDIVDFESFENMTEFENSVKDLPVEKLNEELDKTLKKLKLNYIYVGDEYYSIKEINISDKINEISRVYNRKRISFVATLLSGCFRERRADYALAWDWVNKKFMESTGGAPDFVTIGLQGKAVSFADKLNFNGCVAYKNYLMLIYDYMDNKGQDLETAAYYALRDEKAVDQKYDRNKFYTRYFLPKSINGISKNILKIKVLKKHIKEKTALEQMKNEQ